MKKLFTTLFVCAFAFTSLHAAFTEEYKGSQTLKEGSHHTSAPVYDFQFDFTGANLMYGGDGTDSSLGLLNDVTIGEGPYDMAILTFKVCADTRFDDRADIYLAGNTGGGSWSEFINTFDDSSSIQVDGMYENTYTYALTNAEVQAFDAAGQAQFRIQAVNNKDWYSTKFDLKSVKMVVSRACPVPEPSSYALMLIGLFGLAAYRRRRN